MSNTSTKNSISNLTENDRKMLVLAWQCLEGPPRVDYQKLADLGGYKNIASAASMFSAVRRKLKMGPEGVEAATKGRGKLVGGGRKRAAADNDNGDGDDDDDDDEVRLPAKKAKQQRGKKKTAAASEKKAEESAKDEVEQAVTGVEEGENDEEDDDMFSKIKAEPTDGDDVDERLVAGAMEYLKKKAARNLQ